MQYFSTWFRIFSGCIILFVIAALVLKTDSGVTGTAADGDSSENPHARAEWWSGVIGPPPTTQQIEAAHRHIEKQVKALNRGAYRDAGINGWDDLGPDNIGGRIRAIAVNPDNDNVIYVGAAAGGVWKSTNGGSTWNESTPTVLAYPVTSLAIDPVNPNIIYAATGERNPGGLGGSQTPGVGMLRSTNGGASWQAFAVPTNNQWLASIRINPEDSDILFAGGGSPGGNGTLFRSNDQGETWTAIWQATGPLFSSQIWDIEINPDDTSEIYIGTWNQVLRSTNSGMSFTSMMGAAPMIFDPAVPMGVNVCRNRCEISICANNPDTVYVLRFITSGTANMNGQCNVNTTFYSQVWRTGDDGANWSLLSSVTGTNENTSILTRQGAYDNIIWADPTDCSRALMGGINFWKWENETLTRISNWPDDINGNGASGNNNSIHADHHAIVPEPAYNGSTNARVYIGNDGGIYYSDDIWNATTNSGWSALNDDINITQLYGVDVSLTGDTLIAGSQDNSYFVDRTGNDPDQGWGFYSTGDGGHGAIKKSDPEVIYTSVQNGRVFLSTDGGDTFCRLLALDGTSGGLQCGNFTSLNDNPNFIAPIELDPNDDTRLYIGGTTLFKTEDGGNNWPVVKAPIASGSQLATIEIASGDAGVLWVGYDDGTISMSTNSGTNWSNVNGSLPGNRVNDIAIHPEDHNKVAVALGGGNNQTNIYLSDDAGQNWTNISLSFDVVALSVVWHPVHDDWLYVGTNYGIFASENNGTSWSITPFFSNGEGPVYTLVTELVWQGNGTVEFPYYLVAATHGRGAWRSNFPIYNKYYVDKNCSPCGLGSLDEPFATFEEALDAAGHGTEVVFLSGGAYNEAPPEIIAQRRIRITLDPGAGSSAIIR